MLIDLLPALLEGYPGWANLLNVLTVQGASYGIYLLYTSNNTTGIHYKILQNIKGAVAFQMAEKGDYMSLIGRVEQTILPGIDGRALIKGIKPMLFQAALYAEGDTEIERALNLQDTFEKMQKEWGNGVQPRKISMMPDVVELRDMMDAFHSGQKIPLGISYEDTEICYADLTERYCFVISGMMGSGKSAYMIKLVQLFHEKYSGDRLYIFDSERESMSECSDFSDTYCKCDQGELVRRLLDEIKNILVEREEMLHQSGQSFGETNLGNLQENGDRICIFIDDLKDFVEKAGEENVSDMEMICTRAQYLGVNVFAGGRGTDLSRYNEIESLTRAIISNQQGILLSGSAALHVFFHNNMDYIQKSTELKKKEAYVFNNGSCVKIRPM